MKATDLAQVWATLWTAADKRRANPSLSEAQFGAAILGLVFLAYAESRFDELGPEIEAQASAHTPSTLADSRAKSVLYRGDELRTTEGSDTLRKEHFPDGKHADFARLCKVATGAEIEAQGCTLNLGRYTGSAAVHENDEDFAPKNCWSTTRSSSKTGGARSPRPTPSTAPAAASSTKVPRRRLTPSAYSTPGFILYSTTSSAYSDSVCDPKPDDQLPQDFTVENAGRIDVNKIADDVVARIHAGPALAARVAAQLGAPDVGDPSK